MSFWIWIGFYILPGNKKPDKSIKALKVSCSICFCYIFQPTQHTHICLEDLILYFTLFFGYFSHVVHFLTSVPLDKSREVTSAHSSPPPLPFCELCALQFLPRSAPSFSHIYLLQKIIHRFTL